MLVTVDGNIGSGKSTLLRRLAEHTFGAFEHVVVQEPVDEWERLKDADGTSILEHFYRDMKKYAFPFQSYILLTRINCITDALRAHPGKVVFVERSYLTDRHIFARGLHAAGHMTDLEFSVFEQLHTSFTQNNAALPAVRGMLYLRTSPEVCLVRIGFRARLGENRISPQYLTELHDAHDGWLLNARCPVLRLGGDSDAGDGQRRALMLEEIEGFVAGLMAAEQWTPVKMTGQ